MQDLPDPNLPEKDNPVDNVQDDLSAIFVLTVKQLRARLESGEPLTSQELQVVIRLLKDNDVNIAFDESDFDGILEVPDGIPTFEKVDDVEPE